MAFWTGASEQMKLKETGLSAALFMSHPSRLGVKDPSATSACACLFVTHTSGFVRQSRLHVFPLFAAGTTSAVCFFRALAMCVVPALSIGELTGLEM